MDSSEPSIGHYKSQLKRGFRALRFSPELETVYRRFHRSRLRSRQLLTICLAVVILFAFMPFDLVNLPEPLRNEYLLLRMGIAVPSIILVCLCHFIQSLKRMVTLASMMAVLNVSIGTISLYVEANHIGVEFSYEGILIVMMITFFMAGLRFHLSAACAAITLACFTYATLFLIPESHRATLNLFYVAATIVCGSVGAYSIEYQMRKNFLQHAVVEDLANKDGLTGLFNRSAIMEKLAFLIQYARRENKYMTLYLADVDCFKQYNDAYGHIQGDKCLKQISDALLNCCCRSLDFAGRYGGEEFLLVWFDTKPTEIQSLVNRVHASINQMQIPHMDSSVAPYVTLSGGFLTLIPDDHTTIEALLHHADMALYTSKRKGRNRVTACATPEFA